jgi:hypothetical protein
MEKQDNAYHVKLKIIPRQKFYKTSFFQGIVFDKTPAKAEIKALKALTEATIDINVDVIKHSVVRLRKDFLLT